MSKKADDIRDAEILELQRMVEELRRRVRELENGRPYTAPYAPYPWTSPYRPLQEPPVSWQPPFRKVWY